jgi:PAS domain S-box-containing protein
MNANPSFMQIACSAAQKEIADDRNTQEIILGKGDLVKDILNSIPMGIIIIDPKTHSVVDANTAAIKMIGVSREILAGTICHQHICPAEIGKCPITDLGQRIDLSERILLNSRGDRISIIKNVDRITLGEREFLLESFVDNTERKEAEDALSDVVKELKRSNNELEQFAYVTSHDLQEPLRMVTSFLGLLSKKYKGKLDQDADEYIDFAVDGARRMQNMISDLLAYSRIGTRGKPFEAIDSEYTLKQALNNLQVAIEESGALVTYDPLPTVLADSSQLTQLFQNLVANAIKFRSKDVSPKVHISAESDGEEWIFSVRDNGIGIAQEFFGHIFVIFQRLHGRDEYPGSGMGLAICRKIVERHGGRIWVESQIGQGTAFYFTIRGIGRLWEQLTPLIP